VGFLVYEEDILVKADIIEMLSQHFPDCPVATLHRLDELGEVVLQAAQPLVAVLSAKLPEIDRQFAEAASRHAVVMVSDQGAELPAHLPRWQTVSKPFSSDMLIDAVRSALSSLQSAPS